MDAVEREWQRGARVWPQVQTRPIDISWTLDQRSIMFLVHPGLVAGALAAHEGGEARRVRRPRRARRRSPARSTCSPACRTPASTPSGFVVREVALDSNRDLVGRTLGEIADERGTTPGRAPRSTSSVEEDLGTWFIRADIGHSDADAVGASARASVRACRRERRRRPRRLVRHLRRHRLPHLAVRPRDRRAAARGGGEEDHLDPATIWGLPERGLVREGYARRSRGVRRRHPRPRAGGRVRRLPRRRASGGSVTRSGWTRCVVDGEVTWSASEGYIDGAASWGACDPMSQGWWGRRGNSTTSASHLV